MADSSRIGRNNRRRGQDGEREVVALIRADFGIEHRGRNLGQERDGGEDVNLGPWKVQVKRRRRISLLYECLQSADLIALRADGERWLVAMPWELFVKLAREEIAT